MKVEGVWPRDEEETKVGIVVSRVCDTLSFCMPYHYFFLTIDLERG